MAHHELNETVQCRHCGIFNRAPSLALSRTPICGRCGRDLPTNILVRVIRIAFNNKKLTFLAIAFSGALLYKNLVIDPIPLKPPEQSVESKIAQSLPQSAPNFEDVKPKKASGLEVFKIEAEPILPSVPVNQGVLIPPPSKGLAPFEVIVPQGKESYFVKLVNLDNKKTELTLYINGGQSVKTSMPLGNYVLRYTSGLVWYGDELMFGKNAKYREALTTLRFTENETGYSGHTVTLIPQKNGNLSSEPIGLSRF